MIDLNLIEKGEDYTKLAKSYAIFICTEDIYEKEEIEVELIGLCTDICVVSNALLLKANMPELKISVDKDCCAGVTVEKHLAALETMRSCQIYC